jgi:hypothetical protein
MTILEAGLKSSVYEAAQAYLAAGVSILPLRGKQPALATWATLQRVRPAASSVDHWHRTGQLAGVGVICGKVSGNLVILDFDSSEAVNEFINTFPTLLNTYVVLSGSRRGAHFYYYVEDLPETTKAKNFELMSSGLYVVAPPSPHPSGNHYRVSKECEPLRLKSMKTVVQWINSKRPTPARPAARPQQRPNPHTGAYIPREEYFRRRYVSSAIDREVVLLARTSEGNRNTQLYLCSIALGQLVGAGAVERSVIESDLLKTAQAIGLSDTESLPTIKSGIDAGLLNPRSIPPAPKRLN